MFDFKYLKERFTEYVSMEKSTKKHSDHIDFNIYYGGSGMSVESFSMSKKQMDENLTKALKTNISDVLDVKEVDVKFSHISAGIMYVDVNFSDTSTHWVRLEVKQTKDVSEPTMSEAAALFGWWG